MALMVNRFSGNSLFILDEPEAALSPTRQMAMISRMHDLIEDGAQFLIATHSPIIMAYPEATIYSLSDQGVHQVGYEETEHYQITRHFLNAREKMLKELMS